MSPTPPPPLRIGTRGSDLALFQARQVQGWIQERLGRSAELVIIKTQGDKDRSRSVAALGSVGVFVKELERALQDGDVDLAVHSLKDLPTDQPEGLEVVAQPIRVDAHELLLAHPGAVDERAPLLPLIEGARVGTASERRRAQLLVARPDLEVVPIRGNVPRRVDMARQRELDAVVLAAAGVDRLGLDLSALARFDLPLDLLVPAPGQGALAIEARTGDAAAAELARLDDASVRAATTAERALLHELGAGCLVPLGALATRDARGEVNLHAVLQVNPTASPRPRLRQARVRAGDAEGAANLALRVLDPPPLRDAPQGPDLTGKRVLVAREPERAIELVEAIADAGGEARCRSAIRAVRLPAADGARERLAALPAEAWVLFASQAAVEVLADATSEGGLAAAIGDRRVGAVGPATARALAACGVTVDVLAEPATGAGLAAAVVVRAREPGVALLPAAQGGRPELQDTLAAAGWQAERMELYVSEPAPVPTADELDADALVLASPSGVAALLQGPLPASCRLVAIGPTTARAIEEAGHAVAAVADAPTPARLVAAIGQALLA